MKIDFKNKYIVECSRDIYIHDAIFTGFNYDYKENLVSFEIINCFRKVKYSFAFYNVFGVKLQSCDSWGTSPHILDWEIRQSNDNSFLDELLEKKRSIDYPCSRLIELDKLVDLIFTLTSGDTLIIICEYIILETKYLSD